MIGVTYEELCEKCRNISFYNKIGIYSAVCLSSKRVSGWRVKNNGFIKAIEDYAVTFSDGRFYVYLWRHLDGSVFYVGSGTGNRWTSISGRNESFFHHIDEGDAVVYKVIDGLTEDDARIFERYLSICFDLGGVCLANKDNLVKNGKEEASKEWADSFASGQYKEIAGRVENVIMNKILIDHSCSYEDVSNIYAFRENFGNCYFSSNASRHQPKHLV